MSSHLTTIITSGDPSARDQSLDAFARTASLPALLAECDALEAFRRQSDNLYERVRALFFLYALHRFHLPLKPGIGTRGMVPFAGYEHLLSRRFNEAIEHFLSAQMADGPSQAISSALGAAYQRLGFQTLADQVRRSVRSVRGNQWMFRVGHPADHSLRIRPALLRRSSAHAPYPILREQTPVRMDLSHSAWSDIFFLGMDFPEGARVINTSIDLAVLGRDQSPRPPVETYLRVIDEPVLRLTSVDLAATADIRELAEVFDFAKDYLGLLKAAVIAAGIVPPGIEGSGQKLEDLLARMVGPGLGLEIVSNVHNIPKGSRLAVSTNLLASLISVCMRATGQAKSLTGPLEENERRVAAARAILGEWLGGSGGGWQDSGGLWPGMKLISGVLAGEGDPEFGISRGRLLPNHKIFDQTDAPQAVRDALQASLVLVHGGMAQNVGPILEMVTEKFLLRSEAEWKGRQQAIRILDELMAALRANDLRQVGRLTTRNFDEPIQTIIPWASNLFTETLIRRSRERFGNDFWGFWMLGGMSGGGMGFIFAPGRKREAQTALQETMREAKRELQNALPFAMEPVVYDFSINQNGTFADLLLDADALMPQGYYAMLVPSLLRSDPRQMAPSRRTDLERFGAACHTNPNLGGMVQTLFNQLFPPAKCDDVAGQSIEALLEENGFDRAQHEQIRSDLRNGRIGLAQNRLPASTTIQDVRDEDVVDTSEWPSCSWSSSSSSSDSEADQERGRRRGRGRFDPVDSRKLGEETLRSGAVAVVSLAAGAGSRWTQGAGVVKALHPFCKLSGAHRSFLEVHLAKSRRAGREYGVTPAHIITTSYLTHDPIQSHLAAKKQSSYPGPLLLSPGRAIGLRMIPMERDLRFLWEVMPQQLLDEQAQKVRESLRAALIGWAKNTGEGSDYTDNVPLQCLHPVGHWFEIPNLLRNGVLAKLLAERPQVRTLLVHNIDTLGAGLDPALLGLHLNSGACLTFEMITRWLEDRGGGLARVNGRPRLVEGLAMPREEDEFALSYYNSLTTWVDVDKLLAVFGLARHDLGAESKVSDAIRRVAARLPTYITLKEVKKRWGHGQEDVFPVAQFEKLWGDMTSLPEVDCRFAVVPRNRGQQLKDQAQLDGWLRDGSAAYVESLCEWE